MSVAEDLKSIRQSVTSISPDISTNRAFEAAFNTFNMLTAAKSRSLYNIQNAERLNTNAQKAHILNFGCMALVCASLTFALKDVVKWCFQIEKFKPLALPSRLFTHVPKLNNLWMHVITIGASIAGSLHFDRMRLENANALQTSHKLSQDEVDCALNELHTARTYFQTPRNKSKLPSQKEAIRSATRMLDHLNVTLKQFQQDNSSKPVTIARKH